MPKKLPKLQPRAGVDFTGRCLGASCRARGSVVWCVSGEVADFGRHQ